VPDWNTRLAVQLNGVNITPIETFTPTYQTPVTPIHSIEGNNVGAMFHPQTATFTMTVKAIGGSVAQLTAFAIGGTKFNVGVIEQSGTDWSFKSLLFRDCVITSANPSNAVIDGVPVATFNGIVLGFNAGTDIVT
jgi:hypothetical protein